MPPKRRRRLVPCALVLAIVAVAIGWLIMIPVEEECQPDSLDLGTVAVGAQVEFGVRLLASAPSTFEQLYDKAMRSSPPWLRDSLWKWHPRNRRRFVPVNLSTFAPEVSPPPFLTRLKSEPNQMKRAYNNEPFVDLTFALNTAATGEFSGVVTAVHKKRRSTFPIRVVIRPPATNAARLLIASTPFNENATQAGADFQPLISLLSANGTINDCVRTIPQDLTGYSVAVIAEDVLTDITDDEVTRIQAMIRRGGRIVLPCSYYYRGTVNGANKLLAGFGLEVLDQDVVGHHTVTNIASDAFTRGITNVHFHRPSPIAITDPAIAKLLATPRGSTNGYVAVSRPSGAGEVIVIAASLWWNWVKSDGASQNADFLRHALKPAGAPPGSTKTPMPLSTPPKGQAKSL